jgi:hypothetical protein
MTVKCPTFYDRQISDILRPSNLQHSTLRVVIEQQQPTSLCIVDEDSQGGGGGVDIFASTLPAKAKTETDMAAPYRIYELSCETISMVFDGNN